MGGDGAIGPGGVPLQPGERVLWVGGYRSSFDLDAPTSGWGVTFPLFSGRTGANRAQPGGLGAALAVLVAFVFAMPVLSGIARMFLPGEVATLAAFLVFGGVVSYLVRAGTWSSTADRRTGGAGHRPFPRGREGSAVHTVATYLITDRRVVAVDGYGTAQLPLPQAMPTVMHRSAYGGTVVFETAPGPTWGRITMLNQSHREIGRLQDALRQVNPQAASMMPPAPPTPPTPPPPPAWDSPEARARRPDVPPLEVRERGPVGGGPEPMSVEEQMSRWRRRMAREQDPQPPTGPDPSPPSGPIIS